MVPMALIWWIYHFWDRFWPYFNFVDFRAYFGPFSLVNGVKHENLSPNVNFWSITLKFFLWTPTTHEPEWWQGLSSIQKKCKNGTPYCVGVLWWTICDLVPFSPSPSAMPWSGESKIWIRLHLISWLESWLMTCADQMVDDEKAARLITINRSSLMYFSSVSWTAFLGCISNCTSHLYLWAARSVGAIRRHRCQVDAPERTRCDCS